jgi:hypothetical protein
LNVYQGASFIIAAIAVAAGLVGLGLLAPSGEPVPAVSAAVASEGI